MSKKVLVSLDMNKNEVQNVVMQNLGTAPESPKEGQYYYNSTDCKAYQYVRTSESGATSPTYAWKPLGGAEITVDSALSSTSTNPVQNKVVNAALGNKVDKVSGKGLSSNDYTDAEKEQLANLVAGTITVDTALSDSSTNPVQNKVVKAALDGKQDTLDIIDQGELISSGAHAGSDNAVPSVDGLTEYVASVIGNLPKEQFLDLTKTKFVQSFAWSSETYPGSTNPSLEGKPVLVLVLKNSSDTTVTYSFLNMYELVDTYEADSPIKVTGRKITHMDSTVEPGNKAIDNEVNPSFGGSFAVPGFTVDSKGHLSNVALNMINIPDDTATTNTAGLMSAADKSKLDNTLKLKKAELAIDPSNTSATATLSVSSPTILSVEAMYYDDSKGDGYESVIVDWECDGPTFKASIAQAESQRSVWIYVLYI